MSSSYSLKVRVDLLSAEGSTLSSLSQHSMPHFRSEHVGLLMILFKIAPLLDGLYSETQVMRLNFHCLASSEKQYSYGLDDLK